jgi:hypothetical protein
VGVCGDNSISQSLSKQGMDINAYVGKRAIFVESGRMCMATIADVHYSSEGLTAIFEAEHSPCLSCELRVIRTDNEDAVKVWLESAVFGVRWDIFVSSKEFFYEADYWQASFLFGGGFRVFFNPVFINRFIGRDVTWLEEFFNGQNEESDNDQ